MLFNKHTMLFKQPDFMPNTDAGAPVSDAVLICENADTDTDAASAGTVVRDARGPSPLRFRDLLSDPVS